MQGSRRAVFSGSPFSSHFHFSSISLEDKFSLKFSQNSLKFLSLSKLPLPFITIHHHYTQSPIIRTSTIRLDPEILGKFKTRALGSSNLRTTSKNLRTTRAQIFKAKNGKKWKPCQFCGFRALTSQAKSVHEVFCKNNPFHAYLHTV